MGFQRRTTVAFLACFSSHVFPVLSASSLLDSAGRLLTAPSSTSTDQGVVALISSPATPSKILPEASDALSLEDEGTCTLLCSGATLSGMASEQQLGLAACGYLADAVVCDGIVAGDIESGFRNSRHSRTLTAIFRARLQAEEVPKQTLVMCVSGTDDGKTLEGEIKFLYKAVADEKRGARAFSDAYEVKVVDVGSGGESSQAIETAQKAAKEVASSSESLHSALSNALDKLRESGVASASLDPPHIASAFVMVGASYGKQARVARAKITSWKTRTSRGLLIDGFGAQAEALRERVVGSFDQETMGAMGLPGVAEHVAEQRQLLQELVDSAIVQIFSAQVSNLSKVVVKRYNAGLLKTMNDSPESIVESNAVALRKEAFTFATVMEDLEVPSLGLTKEKATRDMDKKLNDAMMAFPDSAAAKIKRAQQVKKTVNKEKKPGSRGIDLGVDLVAVLRPDGFGTLQGYAGYQLGGNSVTFGIHNDADDPQTIAQFGGVRPPLLRVQPKLRVDVEL